MRSKSQNLFLNNKCKLYHNYFKLPHGLSEFIQYNYI